MKLVLALFLTLLMTAASALASDEYEADAALGYGGETLFPTIKSFEANANQAFGVLSALSLGNVSSYKIFDGGIDPRTVDSILNSGNYCNL